MLIPDHPIILRYSGSKSDTLGLLFLSQVFQHYTLEDEKRVNKVHGDTRIAAGTYPIRLKTDGNKHTQYTSKFPDIHKGMIEICNVPQFTAVLYHIGNEEKDTEGCVLCGDVANNNLVTKGMIQNSADAYKRTYPKLVEYILNTKNPVIEIVDMGYHTVADKLIV